jgi:hypothetical protein
MQRRLEAYRNANNSKVAEPSVQQFFKGEGISLFEIGCDTQTDFVVNNPRTANNGSIIKSHKMC